MKISFPQTFTVNKISRQNQTNKAVNNQLSKDIFISDTIPHFSAGSFPPYNCPLFKVIQNGNNLIKGREVKK